MLPPEALLAGTGLKPQDLNDLARRITVRQALQYIANTLHLAPRPTGIWLGWGPIIAECWGVTSRYVAPPFVSLAAETLVSVSLSSATVCPSRMLLRGGCRQKHRQLSLAVKTSLRKSLDNQQLNFSALLDTLGLR